MRHAHAQRCRRLTVARRTPLEKTRKAHSRVVRRLRSRDDETRSGVLGSFVFLILELGHRNEVLKVVAGLVVIIFALGLLSS